MSDQDDLLDWFPTPEVTPEGGLRVPAPFPPPPAPANRAWTPGAVMALLGALMGGEWLRLGAVEERVGIGAGNLQRALSRLLALGMVQLRAGGSELPAYSYEMRRAW